MKTAAIIIIALVIMFMGILILAFAFGDWLYERKNREH